ncbi:MAG: DUF3494 domain-containing protein, partial [Burkholderiales bacterium]
MTTDLTRVASKRRPLFLHTLAAAAALALAPSVVQAQVTLGPTLQSFGVLAGVAVTNTGPSLVAGNVGVSPGLAITGFPPGSATGTFEAGSANAAQAQTELTAAYNDAAATACNVDLTGVNLGGLTLTPGVY